MKETDQKIAVLKEAGVTIAETPSEIPDLLKQRLAQVTTA